MNIADTIALLSVVGIFVGATAHLIADAISDLKSLYQSAAKMRRNAFITWRALILARKIARNFGLIGTTNQESHEVTPQQCVTVTHTGEIDMTKLETLITAAMGGNSDLDTIIRNQVNQAIGNVVKDKVQAAMADAIADLVMEDPTPYNPNSVGNEPECEPVTSAPIIPIDDDPETMRVEVQYEGETDLVASVTIDGLLVKNAGRFKAARSIHTGELVIVTSNKGTTYNGIIMGETIKPNSNAFIVRPLSSKGTPIRASVPVQPKNIEYVTSNEPKTKAPAPTQPSEAATNIEAPPVSLKPAKKRGASKSVKSPNSPEYTSTEQYDSSAATPVNVKNPTHRTRIESGEPVIIQYSNGRVATTRDGAIKRFKSNSEKGWAVCTRTHKLITADAQAYFAKDVGC